MNEPHGSVCRVRRFQALLLLVSALLTWQNMKATARDKALHPVGSPAVYKGKQWKPENNTATSNFPKPLQPPLPRASNEKTRSVQLKQLPTRNEVCCATLRNSHSM